MFPQNFPLALVIMSVGFVFYKDPVIAPVLNLIGFWINIEISKKNHIAFLSPENCKNPNLSEN